MIRSKSEDDRQKSICDKGGEKMGEWQGLGRSAGNISKHLDDNKPYFPVPFSLALFLMMFLLETREAAAQHHHYFSFDGKDDYIALQMEYQGAEVLSEVTIEAWVRTGFSGAWYYDNWAIIDFDRSEFYTVYIRGDNGRVGFSTYGGTVDDFQGTTAVNDGQWHHVAA
ncbi:MAG: LamG-like jellyroll fold domain-containing protein, partial [Bacteroidota bacterium]